MEFIMGYMYDGLYDDVEKVVRKNKCIGKSIETYLKYVPYIKYAPQKEQLKFILPLLATAINYTESKILKKYYGKDEDDYNKFRVTATYVPLYDDVTVELFSNGITLCGDSEDVYLVDSLTELCGSSYDLEAHTFSFELVEIESHTTLKIVHTDWDVNMW